ncbi:MAG: tyrosine-type recombinase/integrase [Candidatus Dormibacteraceae bacterium]
MHQITAYLGPRHYGTLSELRDRALFYFLLETGARISEALQVTRDNFERVRVLQKGGSEKELRVGPRVAQTIHDYLATRADGLPWLWVAQQGASSVRRLHYRDVGSIWLRLALNAGVAPWTTHQLRHTCATELLEAGIRALVVADYLGHHGLRTLAVYGQVRAKQRGQALDAMEALVNAKIRPDLLGRLSSRGR